MTKLIVNFESKNTFANHFKIGLTFATSQNPSLSCQLIEWHMCAWWEGNGSYRRKFHHRELRKLRRDVRSNWVVSIVGNCGLVHKRSLMVTPLTYLLLFVCDLYTETVCLYITVHKGSLMITHHTCILVTLGNPSYLPFAVRVQAKLRNACPYIHHSSQGGHWWLHILLAFQSHLVTFLTYLLLYE